MGTEASVVGDRVHALAAPDDDDALVATVVDWARLGEAEGDLTVAVVLPWVAERVRDALPGTEVCELAAETPRAPEGIAWQLGLLARATDEGRRLRVVGQMHEDDLRVWDERVRGEAAYEHVLGAAPVATLCVYDRRRTPPDVLDAALRAHPHQLVGGRVVPHPGHVDPAELVASLGVPAEPVQQDEPVLVVDDARSLGALRHALAAALRGRLGDDDAADVHLAASEIAANAFRHGARPVSARVWASAERVVVAISDGGRTFTGPLSGYRPAHGDDLSRGGMGLWLARKLCDHVDLAQTEDGLTVRLTTAVRRPA